MLYLRSILEKIEAIVASGQFIEPQEEYTKKRENRYDKVGTIDDPEVRALYTLMMQQKETADAMAQKGVGEIFTALAQIIKTGAKPEFDPVIAHKELELAKDEYRAFEFLFTGEMIRLFPDISVDALGLCKGWLVVSSKETSKAEEVKSAREELRELLEFVSTDCGSPECPVHGHPAKTQSASSGEN